MKKIYIAGEVVGAYRSQNLIKVLLDGKHKLFYNSINLDNSIKGKHFAKRIIRKIIKIINAIILFPMNVYLMLLSDVIIIPAMNNEKQLEAFIASKIFRKKVVVDFYISLYDTYVNDRKKFASKSIKAKSLMKCDRNIIKNSSQIIFLNESEKEYYLDVVGIPYEAVNSTIIPLCVDEKNKVQLPYFNKHNNIFTICWWGSYIPLHGLEKIISAAELLNQSNFEFLIYFFGNSEEKSKYYSEIILEKKLEHRIIIINEYTFSNGKLADFLSQNCDLVLGNFGDSKKAQSVLVNKLVDGIAMRAPVLTGESKATEEFFDFTNDIWRCTNNPEDIAKKIKEISNCSSDEITRRTNNAYSIYLTTFSEQAYQMKIKQVIDEVSK